jgi:hypothetical protein
MSLTPMGVTTQGHGCFVLKAEFELNRLRMEVSEPYINGQECSAR